MRGYQEISTRQQMNELLDSAAGFDDSIIKELHIANRAYVNQDRTVCEMDRFDVRLLIQSELPPYAMELLFIGARYLTLNDREYFNAEGKVDAQTVPSEMQTIEMSFGVSLRIKADRLFFRVRPNWLGQRAHFKSEVPAPDAVSAVAMENGWRQCQRCANAWEADPLEVYSYCPECMLLTELQNIDNPRPGKLECD